MKKDEYQIRGLRFTVKTTDIELLHLCTFSISLRLHYDSYWVAFYRFFSGSGDVSARLRQFGTEKVIANGAGVLPTTFLFDGGSFPADVIKLGQFDAPKAKLRYKRSKGQTLSSIKIDLNPGLQRALNFNLQEISMPNVDETADIPGFVALFFTDDGRRQILAKYPTGSAPHPAFNPHAQ